MNVDIHDILRIVKYIDTEVEQQLPEVRRGKMESYCLMGTVSVWDDEKVGDG